MCWSLGQGLHSSRFSQPSAPVLKPIQNLTAFAKELGSGNLDQVAAVQSKGEIGVLAAADYLPTSFEKAVPVRINDHEAYLLPRVIGMRDESGKLFGVAIILQDVTRFRLMDEVKTNLVSTVSHELKTPLSSIRIALHAPKTRQEWDLDS